MRKLIVAYVLGVVSVLGLAYQAGPDALVQAGLKYNAVLQTYAYDATVMVPVDEQQIYAELAKPVGKRRGK